ncbi:putative exported protein [Vibrio variabilis]|uniref:Exported protein n=1 Tax=Vibrio variabilis TaxID=990271 RepID=A0ABQ0JQ49_9VIBR|nr:putative exported protein [Vibrio variabilis]
MSGQKSDVEGNIAKLKQTMKLYPYGTSNKTEFINLTDRQYNTVHAMNEKFFDEINTLIQYEPTEIWDQEWIALAQDLGIEKGKAFAPDDRMNLYSLKLQKLRLPKRARLTSIQKKI